MPSVHQVRFALALLRARMAGASSSCPYCDARTVKVETKALVFEMRQCMACGLRFRFPYEDQEASRQYYQVHYSEGTTTDLPSVSEAEDAERLWKSGPLNFLSKIDLLQTFAPGCSTAMDFGSSWGYGIAQLQEAGFDPVYGFEVSRPRADFAERLTGTKVYRRLEDLLAACVEVDAIFCNHVLEHVPNLRATLGAIGQSIRAGGTLLAFVPNGDGLQARTRGLKWGPLLGSRHINAIGCDFVSRALSDAGFDVVACGSSLDNAGAGVAVTDSWSLTSLDGDELVVVARKPD